MARISRAYLAMLLIALGVGLAGVAVGQAGIASSRPASGPAKVPDRFYGINADLIYNFTPKEWPRLAAGLGEIGAGTLRMPVRWLLVEPGRGRWDYARLDAAVAAVPRDVEILAVLMSTPAWASGVDPTTAVGWYDAYPPKDVADWAVFVGKTVERYKHRIRHWEVWNEENGVDFYRPAPDVKGYVAMLDAAYRAAKKADPRCVVVLGGLQMNGIIASPWSPVKVSNYLEDLYRAGAGRYFDVCNVHPYVLPDEGAARMMALLKDTRAVMARYGDADKPLWLTEVGCGTNEHDTAAAQARLLTETYRLARTDSGIARVCWFTLRDLRKGVVGPEDTMGLFALDWRKKPAYEAYRGAVREAGRAASHPAATTSARAAPDARGSLFDGRTLAGWKLLAEGPFEGHADVRVENGTIVLERGRLQTGISWRGEFPRDDYEVSLEAKRVSGNDFFCGMTFPVGESPCTLIVGGWGGMVVGLSNVDDQSAAENETTSSKGFETGQWYRIRLRVTTAKIEVWIDGESVIDLERAGHKFSVWYEQETVRPFGVSTWDTGAALRDIRVRRLAG